MRPGDRIPADGEIRDGTSGIDESPVTGESMPRTKRPGDSVFAGSINAEAVLRVTVTRAAEDNTIARIIKLVQEAETARAPTERFIDRFSRIYIPRHRRRGGAGGTGATAVVWPAFGHLDLPGAGAVVDRVALRAGDLGLGFHCFGPVGRGQAGDPDEGRCGDRGCGQDHPGRL